MVANHLQNAIKTIYPCIFTYKSAFETCMSSSSTNNSALPAKINRSKTHLLTRYAWLPIPVLLIFMLIVWACDIHLLYNSPYTQIVTYLAFSSLAGVVIASLTGRRFSINPSPGILLLGCGALLWGFAGISAIIASLIKKSPHAVDVNIQVTIHNICMWLAAWCHLAGIGISLRWQVRVTRWKLWLAGAYLAIPVAIVCIVQAVFSGSFPLFFLQGSGGTPIRQLVLGSSIGMLLLSALLLQAMHRKRYSLFLYWYSLALLLMATGLFGVMMQSVHSGLLGWIGRSAQALGGIYMMRAAMVARRESLNSPIPEQACERRFSYGVSAVFVVTAVIVRVLFMQSIELPDIFFTFYPAIIFSALYGGLASGLLATVFSLLMARYFFVSPMGQISFAPVYTASILFFIASGAILSWITAAMQQAQDRAIRAEAETALAAERLHNAELLKEHNTLLEQHVTERTVELALTVEKLKQEISFRSIIEKELRHSEETLQLAIKSTGLGTFDYYPQSGMLFWSEVNKWNFGISPNVEVDFDQFVNSIHPEDRNQVLHMMDKALQPGSSGEYRLDYRIIGIVDGGVRWISERGQAFFNDAGQAVRFIGVSRDITREMEEEDRRHAAERALQQETEERLKTLEALRRKEQMLIQQSRQAAMGEMIGNIAHQWRQPLNTLGLTIQQLLLFHELGELNREFLEECVGSSMQLVLHMSQTIDDFRNYFKPDKEKVAFSVNETLNRTISLMSGSLNDKCITVQVNAQVDPVVWGYPNEFSHVLLNIMTNAKDVLIERAVSNPSISVTVDELDKRAIVTITDNAGGIAEQNVEKIFDPYFTTKGPQDGTGVGLFMSKAIIEKNMGGRLSVRNLEAGAEFRIEI